MRRTVTHAVAIVLLLTISARLHAQSALQAPASSAAAGGDVDVATAPIELDGVTLFRVRGVSSLPAGERAARISERLQAVAADRAISIESIRTVEREGITQILAGDAPLLAVVEADAVLEQVGRAELALAHVQRLRQAITEYRAARAPGALRNGVLMALLATLMLAIAIVLLVWVGRLANRVLTSKLQTRIHAVSIHSFEVMRAEQIWHALGAALTAARMLVLLAIVLPYLSFVFAQFPWTKPLSRDMTAFAIAPLRLLFVGFLAQIPSLVFLAVLFFIVRVTLRLVRLFFEATGRGSVSIAGFDREWARPTYKIARIAIVCFALVIAYPYIPGSETPAFKGVSLFMGVVFSLGSSSAISNIVAGYMMTYRRALKVGDRVKIGNAIGDVIDMRVQVTHLRSLKNEEIVLPNSQILTSDVINYSSLASAQGLILHTEVGIGYETPWRQVEAMLMNAADRTSGLLKEPAPFVLEKQLADFAVVYELNAYSRSAQTMLELYAELHRNILDVFNEYDVQIMTPAYVGDPAERKVVARNAWYTQPATPPAGPQIHRRAG